MRERVLRRNCLMQTAAQKAITPRRSKTHRRQKILWKKAPGNSGCGRRRWNFFLTCWVNTCWQWPSCGSFIIFRELSQPRIGQYIFEHPVLSQLNTFCILFSDNSKGYLRSDIACFFRYYFIVDLISRHISKTPHVSSLKQLKKIFKRSI